MVSAGVINKMYNVLESAILLDFDDAAQLCGHVIRKAPFLRPRIIYSIFSKWLRGINYFGLDRPLYQFSACLSFNVA